MFYLHSQSYLLCENHFFLVDSFNKLPKNKKHVKYYIQNISKY